VGFWDIPNIHYSSFLSSGDKHRSHVDLIIENENELNFMLVATKQDFILYVSFMHIGRHNDNYQEVCSGCAYQVSIPPPAPEIIPSK
jgi:hypothetical protein